MYRGIFFSFISECNECDGSSVPHYVKKVEHGNVMPSVVNVWIQQGGNYTHCNLLPVHYSCYIMGFTESCITVCITNYTQVVCHKMYQVFLVLVLLLIPFEEPGDGAELLLHCLFVIPFYVRIQLMTVTLFALVIGALFFQLDTDELGFTNRYVCLSPGV